VLRAAGFELLGGTLLFRLVRHASAAIFVQRLGQHGIHVRAFPDAPEQLRFGLPGNDPAFRRLAAALGV
jgi:cobalamin biosynthetic protein CobC